MCVLHTNIHTHAHTQVDRDACRKALLVRLVIKLCIQSRVKYEQWEWIVSVRCYGKVHRVCNKSTKETRIVRWATLTVSQVAVVQ